MSQRLPRLTLPENEHTYLQEYVSTGRRSARAIKRAHVLLESAAGLPVLEISARVGVSPATVYNIRHRYEAEGVQAALEERPRSGQPRKLKLEQEAQLTVLACSDAPVGHARWTMRLLADKVVELGIVEHIAPETVRQFLKKTNSSLGASSSGVSVRQCLDRRLASQAQLEHEVLAWQDERNAAATTIQWTFTVSDARHKLKRHYQSVNFNN